MRVAASETSDDHQINLFTEVVCQKPFEFACKHGEYDQVSKSTLLMYVGALEHPGERFDEVLTADFSS
jgi:hypothetical protein